VGIRIGQLSRQSARNYPNVPRTPFAANFGDSRLLRLGPAFGPTIRFDGCNFPISEAVDEVIVHHSNCLHMGVNDRGTHEAESAVFQVFAQRIGLDGGGWDLFHDFPAVHFGLSTDKAPRIRIKTSELLLNR